MKIVIKFDGARQRAAPDAGSSRNTTKEALLSWPPWPELDVCDNASRLVLPCVERILPARRLGLGTFASTPLAWS